MVYFRIGMRTWYRVVCYLSAWITGWIVYMVAMVSTVYDGFLSLLFQPIMAALWSFAFTLGASLAGMIFLVPVVGKAWRGSCLWAATILSASLFVMVVGPFLGWTETFPGEVGSPITVLRPDLALTSYFALLFAIANWPATGRLGRILGQG